MNLIIDSISIVIGLTKCCSRLYMKLKANLLTYLFLFVLKWNIGRQLGHAT